MPDLFIFKRRAGLYWSAELSEHQLRYAAQDAQIVLSLFNILNDKLLDRGAGELGNISAMYDLGWLMCHEGIDAIIDNNKAMEWLTKASGLGHIEAKFKLSYMYNEGIGEPIDAHKSFHLILELAEVGHTYAKYKVGLYYLNGYGLNKDLERAFEWISQTSKQGCIEAYDFLSKNGSQILLD